MNINITQRQAGLGMLVLSTVGAWLSLLLSLAQASSMSEIGVFVFGAVLFTLLLVVYVRFKHLEQSALSALLVVYTALIIFGLPQPFVNEAVTFALLTPSLLSFVLLNEVWTLGVGAATMMGVLIRAGGQGLYVNEPMHLLIYAIAVLMLVLGRLVTNTAQRAAELNAARAETALARAEAQAEELADANHLMEIQLNQQNELLSLVATLEVPTVPLVDGVLLAPIVGHLDSRRAEMLNQHLLQESAAQRAKLVILDIAGVPTVDTAVAQRLLQTVQALRLIGCDVNLSGISATAAITLTHLGVDLTQVQTVRSPQEALSNYWASPIRRN